MMDILVTNIFENLPLSDLEVFEDVISDDKFKLERIISKGHSTPEGEWYDQAKNEWVLLISGSAGILFEDKNITIDLKPGDHLLIPAHKKHRVDWTDKNIDTIWLALHY